MTGPRVPGCWACQGGPEPPGIPHDALSWWLIALHELIGHRKAEAYFLSQSARRQPVVTVRTTGDRL